MSRGWLWRNAIGAGPVATIAIALVFGQAKLELTLAIAAAGWPWWAVRGAAYAVAIIATLACYAATERVRRRIDCGTWESD